MRFLFFLAIFLFFLTLGHLTFLAMVQKAFALPSGVRPWFHLLGLILALSFFLIRLLPQIPASWAFLTHLWFGIIFIALTLYPIGWFMEPFLRHPWWIWPGILSFLSLLVIISVSHDRLPPKVREITLSMEGAPMTICHLSDLHINRWTSPTFLAKILENLKTHAPDLIVLTGDTIDDKFTPQGKILPFLQSLKAPLGVYAITGNHEYYIGMAQFDRLCQKAGIQVLHNRFTVLSNGWIVAGVDDPTGESMSQKASPFPWDTLPPPSSGTPILFLSHRPKVPEPLKAYPFLQLSGHTHAGQIPPMDFLVFLTFSHPFGLDRVGKGWIYTTSGTGTWGPPMRLWIGKEIPLLKVEKARN